MIEQLTDISSFDWKKVGKTRDDGGNLPENENPSVSLENQDIDGQHKKFGGNKSLRGDNNLGFDQPFIIKEIGDRYDSLGLDDGIFRGGAALNLIRVAEDVTRFTKWTLTPKGIIWNLKQALLQSQNAIKENRFYNPLGVIGSIVPAIHLSRTMGGGGFNPLEEPEYPSDSTKDRLQRLQEEWFPAEETDLGKTNFEKFLDTASSLLGLNNEHFTKPIQYVKSDKGPGGEDLNFDYKNEGSNKLITDRSKLETFRHRRFGQSDARYQDKQGPGKDGTVGMEAIADGYESVINEDVSILEKSKFWDEAKYFNLGKGLVKTSKSGKLYSVGVSNQLQVPYHGTFANLKEDNLPKDFIKFRIRDAVNGKWLIFPAYLGGIIDTISPTYNTEQYLGRPDQIHVYGGTTRTISFDFKVAAMTKQEIPIIQEKMNYLVGLGYPTFKKMFTGDDEARPVAPFIYLTIGDLWHNTPGYFSNITITTEENVTWEIDEGFQIPQVYTVAVEFVYIGKYLPHTTGKHFEIDYLKDGGVPYGTFEKNPRIPGNDKPNRTNQGKEPEWSKQLG